GLFYYLRVIAALYSREEALPKPEVIRGWPGQVVAGGLAIGLIVLGVYPPPFIDLGETMARLTLGPGGCKRLEQAQHLARRFGRQVGRRFREDQLLFVLEVDQQRAGEGGVRVDDIRRVVEGGEKLLEADLDGVVLAVHVEGRALPRL